MPEVNAGTFLVHKTVFPPEAETHLVNKVPEAVNLSLSRVAEGDGEIVGHTEFSPVWIDNVSCGIGLAPSAVLPELQQLGIGRQLVQQGIAITSHLNHRFIVVLGSPKYSRKFGSRKADDFGLKNGWGVDDEFMVLELKSDGVPEAGGLVNYGQEFAAFGSVVACKKSAIPNEYLSG